MNRTNYDYRGGGFKKLLYDYMSLKGLLSIRQKMVLHFRLIDKLSLRETAIQFGVTTERIRQIEANCIQILEDFNEEVQNEVKS